MPTFGDYNPEFWVIRHGDVVEAVPAASLSAPKTTPEDRRRGEIKGLSQKAWRRMVLALATMEDANGFVTLTYPGDWRAYAGTPRQSKRQLRYFRDSMMERWGVRGGVWILEFQPRPNQPPEYRWAPHYHLWTIGGHGSQMLRTRWVREFWGEKYGGVVSRYEAVREPGAAARYAAKEGGKRLQKDPPADWPPGRYWGLFGEVRQSESETIGKFSLSDLPSEVRRRKDGNPFRLSYPDPSHKGREGSGDESRKP